MSGPKAYPTLLDVQRTDTDLRLEVRTAEGEVEQHTFGLNDGSTAPYRAMRVSHSLNPEPGTSELLFVTCRNREGDLLTYGVQTDDLDRFLPLLQPVRYNLFTAIKYADDHITLEFIAKDGTPATFTFGVVDDHFEYTLTEYGATWRDEDMDFTLHYYRLRNRAGEDFRLQVLLPAEQVREFAADEGAYFQALDKKHSPKHDAANPSYAFNQAA